LAFFDRSNAVKVNFKNAKRAPLLLIAGQEDHIVQAAMNRSNFAKYRRSKARTDFKEFPGRVHWIIDQEGWQEVVQYFFEWLS
jgi:dipeptidyl aminopeptidase/acylaminoacyl peptidase